MQFTIVRDGERTSVEVSDDLASATVNGRTVPVKVVARKATRVELEIAGERIVVDQWPISMPVPPGPVDVDGERWSVELTPESGARPPSAAATPSAAIRSATGPEAAPAAAGIPVVPPMPGKVVDLRVRDGERVAQGQLLLVLEAMKMRNEVVSPVAGTVRGISVTAGANVRAREPMLYVAPDPS